MTARSNRPCVLFVDDCAAERDLYTFALEPDVVVRTAARGDEALSVVGIDAPDAIVLDVQMPDLDGRDVCRRLKQRAETAAIPVIFLTGADDDAVIAEAWRVGAAAVLTKPCPADVLLRAIRAAVAGGRPAHDFGFVFPCAVPDASQHRAAEPSS